jgi:K+-transporting ATPase ATPase F chain
MARKNQSAAHKDLIANSEYPELAELARAHFRKTRPFLFTPFLRRSLHSISRFYAATRRLGESFLDAGVKNGHRVDCRHRGDVAGDGRDGGRALQARRAQGRAFMISLEVLYGFGGLLTVLLFAYLVFALICAEEF